MKLLILFTPLRVQETCSVELIGALFQSLHLLTPPLAVVSSCHATNQVRVLRKSQIQ